MAHPSGSCDLFCDFGIRVRPFSASPGAGAPAGRSHGSWLRPSGATALGEAKKGPKTTKLDLQKTTWMGRGFPRDLRGLRRLPTNSFYKPFINPV